MELVLENLVKNYGKNPVIRGATYTFTEGKIYGLIGRNGAGKTTLFNMLYGNSETDSGRFFVRDNGEERELTIEDIGMVFSEPYLPDFLTGHEYLNFVSQLHSDLDVVDMHLDNMEFAEKERHKLIKTYSSGMKSKLSLIAMRIQNPKIILLDEPLTAVDVVAAAEIKALFRSLRNDHILIVSTHILDLAKDLCDEIVLLNEGKLQSLANLKWDEDFEANLIEALRESSDV